MTSNPTPKPIQPFYPEDWQRLAASPGFQELLSPHPQGYLFIEQTEIDQHLQLESATATNEISNLSDAAKKAAKQAIDLAQLSSLQMSTPMAILLIAPDSKRHEIEAIVKTHFPPEMQTWVLEALYITEESAQCFAVNLGPIFLKALDNHIAGLLDPDAEPCLSKWVADFQQAAHIYYDKNERNIPVSDTNWRMLVHLVRAAVLNPVGETLPAPYKKALQKDSTAALKAAEVTMAFIDTCPTQSDTFESYQARVQKAESYGIELESTGYHNSTNPIHIEYTPRAHLHIQTDSSIDEVHQTLEALFPTTYNNTTAAVIKSGLPLTSAGTLLTNYKLPLKTLVRVEASQILNHFKERTDLKLHTYYYSMMKQPFLGDINLPTKEETAGATKQHFLIGISEMLKEIMDEQQVSPALKAEPNFTRFINDWIDIYLEGVENRMAHYSEKVSVLLDRYYPITAGRRI